MVQLISAKPASLPRVLTAMVYDAFLIIGLMLAAVFAFTAANSFKSIAGEPWKQHLLTVTLLCIWGGFYIYFWPRQGQTLGMRAWKLILIDPKTNRPPTVQRCLARWCLTMAIVFAPVFSALAAKLLNPKKDAVAILIIFMLPLVIGYSCALFDRGQKRSLFDRLSGTRLVQAERNPYQKSKEK